MPTDLVPFGKYKGQPVEVIATDREYADWLLQQAWFVQRYPQIHTLVINNFGEPTETPEHNALQIRLLDETFRAQCTEVALRFFDLNRDWTHTVDTWDGWTTMSLSTPYFRPPPAPTFEVGGIDVFWKVARWSLIHRCGHYWPARLPDTHETAWVADDLRVVGTPRIALECKPVIGDDYPAILRFLKNIPKQQFDGAWRVVLAGAVDSRTVPLAAIKQFFALSHILLVLVEEVEAAEFPDTVHCLDTPALPEAHATYLHSREGAQRCSACVAVPGRQTPVALPFTPARCWEVLQHHVKQDTAWDQVLRQRFFQRVRFLALDGDVMRLGPAYPGMTEGDVLHPVGMDILTQTLTQLMGRTMQVVFEHDAGGETR